MEENSDPVSGYSVRSIPTEQEKQGCCSRCLNFMKTSNFLLYCSHTLSAAGDRMWSFAVGLFLITLSPDSLRLTAIYGFVSGGFVLLLGALIGDAVDRHPRLLVAQTALLINNISVAVCAVIVCLTLIYLDDVKVIWDGWLEVVCQAAIVITATIGDLASVGRTISIERDWIVVMCHGDKHALTNLSAFLRRIDLVTNLAAPIVTGQVITYGSSVIGAVFLGAWNVLFMFVEYSLLYAIYKRIPELASKEHLDKPIEPSETTPLNPNNNDDAEADNQSKQTTCCDVMKLCDVFITTGRGWRIYIQQDILPAGLALALLYMTVLGFDNITTGYAVEQGLTESIIGILRGVGAVFGVCGTAIFPLLRKKLGLKKTGLITYGLDITLLIPTVVSVFVAGSPFVPDFYINPEKYASPSQPFGSGNSTVILTTEQPAAESVLSIWLLMSSIVVSRCTLWMCDLTVTQLLLEEPPEEARGIVNGVQNSLNKFMDLIKFVLVMVLPLEQTFGYLILASFTCIVMGGVFYTIYACKPTKEESEDSARDKKAYEDI